MVDDVEVGGLPSWEDTRHLWRLCGLLGLGVAVFFVLRSAAIPHSFGRDGAYRADARIELAARPVTLPPAQACVRCHEEQGAAAAEAAHASVHCMHCHGAAPEHVARGEDGTIADVAIPKDRAVCRGCHLKVVGRPPGFPQIAVAAHLEENEAEEPDSPGTCFECHEGHDPAP